MRTVVIALGGNALTREGQAGTYEEQRANAVRQAGGDVAIVTSPRRAAAALAGTHGTRVVASRKQTRVAAGA
ncbi:MAG: hypothetical protein HYU54_05445 [Actinobacteria bacterium]|nr:hypothetical protein [Actinomycetota bacterium]